MAYAVYPHTGSWRDARTVELAQELNLPLVPLVLEPRDGELHDPGSFFALDGEGVVLTAVKRAEDGDGLVLRLVENLGNEVDGWVELPGEIGEAIEVDLLERRVGDATFEGNRLRFAISGHEIKSFLVTLR
jgi:alpha-mannosidase